jgi:hypothetical protein
MRVVTTSKKFPRVKRFLLIPLPSNFLLYLVVLDQFFLSNMPRNCKFDRKRHYKKQKNIACKKTNMENGPRSYFPLFLLSQGVYSYQELLQAVPVRA